MTTATKIEKERSRVLHLLRTKTADALTETWWYPAALDAKPDVLAELHAAGEVERMPGVAGGFVYRAKIDPRTFCNDGATAEPWTLHDFEESNAEDPALADMLSTLRTLNVGASCVFGGGSVPEMTITRLS